MRRLSALVWKDVAVELRRKETVLSMVMFGLLVMVIFSFAFDATFVDVDSVAPGALWVALTFAGMIGLNRALAIDLDNDALQGLLAAPLSRGALYAGKVASNFIFMLLADVVVLALFIVFNDREVDSSVPWLALVTLLGTLGFAVVGTILSMVAASTRMREVMLPILQVPITLPLIIAAVGATIAVIEPDDEAFGVFVNMMIGFDIIFFAISYMVFEFVVEE
jgi:heme exporter protein B